MIKTLPMEQWAVARELRQRIKARFDHEGIEIPFAQRVVWHREEQRQAEQDRRRAGSGRVTSGQGGVERDRRLPARAWLTGQPALASSAAATKSSSLMPSTMPRTVSRIWVMPVPGTKSTSAEVSSAVGGVPALARPLENAIEKHAECAAAISSSGLVLPFGSSVRAGQDTS